MSWISPKVTRKASPNKGFGLFASENLCQGELICVTVGKVLTTEEALFHPMPYHCFQIELNLQLAPMDLNSLTGIFTTNHSCEPNAGLRNGIALVAMRGIRAGEEICFDYVMSDCTMGLIPTVSMECKCGTKSCRGTITDTDWRDPVLQGKYQGYFSLYLAEILKGN